MFFRKNLNVKLTFNFKAINLPGGIMKKLILFFVSLFLIGCASVPSGYVKIDKEFLAEKIENTFNDSLFNVS